MKPDYIVDLLIIGSGAACAPAALQARALGKSVLVIEKLAVIGGSTAYSGGVGWFPNTRHLHAAGGDDSFEKARRYIDTVVGPCGPGSSAEKRDAFVRAAPETVDFLEKNGMRFTHAGWPDYYSSAPGGTVQGRSLVAPMFNIAELGEWSERFAGHPLFRHVPFNSNEAVFKLALFKRTWPGRIAAAKVAWRMTREKLTGQRWRGGGQAFQGRLIKAALVKGVPFWANTPCISLLIEDGRVVGAKVLRDGEEHTIRARSGVLLNSGGFARNQEMRTRYHRQPSSTEFTEASPGDTGDLILEGQRCGAAIASMDAVIYVASSRHHDGSTGGFHQPNDVGKPHCIVVNQNGQRFVNEACSYMEFGRRMYEDNMPSWAIFDSRHRERYLWGVQLPGKTPESWFENNYAKRGNSIEDLARQCEIDPANLSATVQRFNAFAHAGVDEHFGRGSSAYNKIWGDPSNDLPNPTLGTLEKAPFYAVKLLPIDVGTAGGLVTDEHARVLREDGTPIDGLYATGNTAASVFCSHYIGAGTSISSAMIFGYLAAKHACEQPLLSIQPEVTST